MTTGLVLRQMLRERTRSLVFWTLGTVVFVVLMIAAWPSVRDTGDTFDEYVQSLPEGLQEVFGLAGASIASPEGYLVSQTYSNLWPIILLVLGFGLGAWAVAGSEADGTLEMVLANPVRRGRTAAERFVGTALAVAVVTAVSTAALALIAPFVDLDEGLPAWGFWAAGLTMFAFVLVHVALTFAVGAATGSKGLAIAVGAGRRRGRLHAPGVGVDRRAPGAGPQPLPLVLVPARQPPHDRADGPVVVAAARPERPARRRRDRGVRPPRPRGLTASRPPD
jgi:ABC-2 type transport system permease protein